MELVSFPASHRAFPHMKPRGSLAATVLTENKTLLQGSADLDTPHGRREEAFCLAGGGAYFSVIKNEFGK